MLEIKLVRENWELVKTAMQNRGTAFDWEAFQDRDARRKTLLFELEALRRQRNSVSDQVARMKRDGENTDAIIGKMRDVSTTIKNLEKIWEKVNRPSTR
jgi:seryl-tRNA synthetase